MNSDNELLDQTELGVASELTHGPHNGSGEIGGFLKQNGICDDD